MNRSVFRRPFHRKNSLHSLALLLFFSLMLGCGGGGGGSDNSSSNNGNNTAGGNTAGGNTDGGNTDGGNTDGGNTDGGNTDGGNTDGGNTGTLPQTIFINEASSSNSAFEDEDGDSPDWFELYNSGSTSIDLTDWSITDDILEPAKWLFPNMAIAPGTYLRVWASDKDRSGAGIYKTLVNRGDTFRYLIPLATPSSDWTSLGFNDSNWPQGASGFGYADGDDATLVPTGTASVYARILFTINDLELMENLWLDMDFDDGFIAHINGVEVARSNMLEATPSFNSTAIVDREATIYQSGKPVRFEIDEFRTLLNEGENILSIQVHNISNSSSDLSLIPYLSAFYLGETTDGISPPDILAFENTSLHTNFKISSIGESLILFDSSGNQVDQLDVMGLTTDKSIGRSLEDGSLVYFEAPSPGSENSSEEFTGITLSEIVFSHNGGEFNGQSISLSGAARGEQIRYTLDATVPNPQSPLYSSAISIDEDTVVRARVFQNGYIPSRTASRTYITSNTHSLPIVTLVTEPDNFFDEQQGIYVYGPEENYEDALPFFGANFWQDWERDIHFSFYEPTGQLGVALDAGVKIFGAWSRANNQRSLSIFARSRYGFGKLEYPLFPELGYDRFESIVLRNAGNDWMQSNMRDVMATSLMDGSGLETQAYRPVAVYLNGEYWGFYNIREKVNEHFLDDKIDVDKSEINLLVANGEVSEGSNDSYNQLIDYVRDNSLVVQDNFNYVASQIDI
ncbi:MAG: CotH kinase family protein, partial [Porticoccaceae bacterium]